MLGLDGEGLAEARIDLALFLRARVLDRLEQARVDGLAAVRDFMSFLKYGSASVRQPDPGGDWTRPQRAIAFGSSQSGRFLRTYLY